MSDERHNSPSASAMWRISNCPASFKFAQQFPNTGSADSATGDKIHKALQHWSDAAPVGLDHHELETAEMCIDARNTLLDEWVGEGDYEAWVERRLGLTSLGLARDVESGTKLKFVFTGQADYIAIDGKRGFIADYKTLMGDHTPAQDNDQLRCLAVLLYLRYDLDSVRVALIQPWKGKPTVADYDRTSLEAAHKWLLATLAAEERATLSDTRAGEWCKYCPAKVSCVAFQNLAMTPVEMATQQLPSDPEIAKKAMFARAAELSDADLAARYEGLKMVAWYVNAVEGNVRMRASAEGAFSSKYYHLVEGKAREAIDDVAMVWTRMEQLGVKAEDFTRECKTSKKAVMGLLRAATGEKGKALESIAKGALEGAVKLSKPPLKLVPVGGMIEDEEAPDDL